MPTSPSQTVNSVLPPTISGRKTMSDVNVEAITAIATAAAPSVAALRAFAFHSLPAVDGLENHDRIVDEHPDAEHQPHHRQDVERHPEEVHDPCRGDDREGNRERDDERRGKPPQEEVEDDDREQAALQAGRRQPLEATDDLVRLIVPREHPDALEQRVVLDVAVDDLHDGANHVDGVRGRLLVDVERDGVLAVEMPPEVDRRLLVGHLRDVGDPEPARVDDHVA